MEEKKHIGLDKLLEMAKTLRTASPSDKQHIAECGRCSTRFAGIILRLAAWEDSYIWDENSLDPVPESVMQKMREAAGQWMRGDENEIEKLIGRFVEDFSAWLITLFKPQSRHRFAVAVANPVGLQLRIRLLEKAREVLQSLGYQTASPRANLLNTYLDLSKDEHINSQGDREARFLLSHNVF